MTGDETADYHPIVSDTAEEEQARGAAEGSWRSFQIAGQLFLQHLADEAKAITNVDEEDMAEAGEEDVKDWLRELKLNYPDSTVKTRFYNLRSFFSRLEEMEVIDEDPSEDISIAEWIDKRGVTRTQKELAAKEGVIYLKEDEFERLLEHVPEPRGRNVLMLRLMWQTGIRASEVGKIWIGDIDCEERKITIRTSKRDGHVRDVWWQPSLNLQMRRWLDADRDAMPTSDSPHLFITRYSRRLAPARPNRVVTTAAENADVQEIKFVDAAGMERQKITSHVLRHSFAVHFVWNGGDIKTLRDLLGHASISTTEKYLRFKSETKRDKLHRFGPE